MYKKGFADMPNIPETVGHPKVNIHEVNDI